MKNTILNSFLSGLFFLVLITNKIQAQSIAINTTSASADASSILDITSSNKGLLIPRVSLQSLSDGSTISSPATSLLIYNTNTGLSGGAGFYYNSGTTGAPSWAKLLTVNNSWNLSGNSGTTPGTDYLGTADSKDLILKTNGTQRMSISSTGSTKIGDGANDMLVDPDGTVSLEGNATVFNDIVVPLFNTKLGDSKQPIWVQMINNGSGSRGVYTFTFEDQNSASNEEEVFFSVQLPHNWKEGSPIFPHIHWSPQAATAGSVVWGLEYSWVKYDANTPVKFPNTTLIQVTSAAVASGDVDKHLLTAFNSITPGSNENKISGILMCRLYRKSADAADTFSGNAAVLSFDFHYEIDAVGSRTEYTK